jgi:hypothetical protein
LKPYLKYGEYAAVLKQDELLSSEQKKHLSLLEKELGEINEDYMWLEKHGFDIHSLKIKNG